MAICFTRLIRHGGDFLHSPLPQNHLHRLMGFNLGTCNIWDGRGFGLPLSIWAVERWNYDLMLLMETNIPDAVY